MFYPYEGYRSVTPLDAARVNRTIFHNHSMHRYYTTLIKGRYYNEARERSETFFPWFSKGKKPLHDGLYEHRVPKNETKHSSLPGMVVCVSVCLCECVCDSTY